MIDWDTDPLSDLGLVPLWQDVNVRLEGAGVDDGFVPDGREQRQINDGDRDDVLTVARRKPAG